MTSTKRVLLIGLDPSVVDYSKWPGLTPERLLAGFQADQARFAELGHDARLCFVDRGETAEATVVQALAGHPFDCVLVGAGVRTDAEHFLLFEKLINVVHANAPASRICFNTGPTDSVAAVQRWI